VSVHSLAGEVIGSAIASAGVVVVGAIVAAAVIAGFAAAVHAIRRRRRRWHDQHPDRRAFGRYGFMVETPALWAPRRGRPRPPV
jgi:hypothetical protein